MDIEFVIKTLAKEYISNKLFGMKIYEIRNSIYKLNLSGEETSKLIDKKERQLKTTCDECARDIVEMNIPKE